MTGSDDASGTRGESYLLCARKDGTGARLSNLLWTWRLASQVGARTLVFWPPMDSYYGETTGVGDLIDIFELTTSPLRHELQIVDGRPADAFTPEIIDLDPAKACDVQRYLVDPSQIYRNKAAPPVPVIQTATGPLLMRGETRKAASAQAGALFARLPFRQTIRRPLKLVRRAHDMKSMVAVHVRRGDIIEVLQDACAQFTPEARRSGSVFDRYTEHFFRCCAPVETYERVLRPLLEQGKTILLFSDTAEMAAPFLERFGERVILASALAPPKLTGLQQAVFEVLLMGACPVIVGTKSLFGNLAAVLNGAYFIDVRNHATAEEFVSAYRQAIGFERMDGEVRAAVGEVLVRKLRENTLSGLWNAADDDILRILRAA